MTLAVLALTIFTASMLRYYQSDSTPWGITLLIGVSWFLGFAGVLLLPFDIADVQVCMTCHDFQFWGGASLAVKEGMVMESVSVHDRHTARLCTGWGMPGV